MMKYTTSIYYKQCPEGYCPNYPLEQELDKKAQEYGGESVGSGMMMGTGERDVQFDFMSRQGAEDFIRFLRENHTWIDEIEDIREY